MARTCPYTGYTCKRHAWIEIEGEDEEGCGICGLHRYWLLKGKRWVYRYWYQKRRVA